MLTDIRLKEDIKRHVDLLMADGKTKLAIVSECMRLFSHLYPDMNNFIAWNNLVQDYIDNKNNKDIPDTQNIVQQPQDSHLPISATTSCSNVGKQELAFQEYLTKLNYKKSTIESVINNIKHFNYNSQGIAGNTSIAFFDICTIDKFNDVVKKKWGSEANILVSMKPKFSNSLLLYKDFLNSLPKDQFDPFAFLKKDHKKEVSDTSKQNNATKQDSRDNNVVEFSYNLHNFSWRSGDYTALSDLFGKPNSLNEDPSYLFRRRALFIFMKSTTASQINKERKYKIPANVKTFIKNYKDKYGTETTRIFIFVCDDNKVAQFYDEVTFIEAKDNSILVKTVLHE